MGVKGLWQLIEPTGKPVTLESLEGKVLAVDASIWLNQTVKGMRDRHGNPLPNAHLIGLFHRVCKLLFYRIRPVFVFDGATPALKKQTLAARRQKKDAASQSSHKASKKLLENLLKQHAVRTVLGGHAASNAPVLPTSTNKKESDLFQLPAEPDKERGNADVTEETAWELRMEQRNLIYEQFGDLEKIDLDSEEFKSLPADVRHEILTELKLERKQNHWSKMHEMPQEANSFSSFQVKRLMTKSKLSRKIDHVVKELNAGSTADVAASLGQTEYTEAQARRIISEDAGHYILIKGLSKQLQSDKAEDILNKQEKITKEEVYAKPDTNSSEENDDNFVTAKRESGANVSDEPKPSTSGLAVYVKDEPVTVGSSDDDGGDNKEISYALKRSVNTDTNTKDLSAKQAKLSSQHGNVSSSSEDKAMPSTHPSIPSESKIVKLKNDNVKKTSALTSNFEFSKSKGRKDTELSESDSSTDEAEPRINQTTSESQEVKRDLTLGANDMGGLFLSKLSASKVQSFTVPATGFTGTKQSIQEKQKHEQQHQSSSSDDSDDEGFIEITFDPATVKPDDELFPASIFETPHIPKESKPINTGREQKENEFAPVEVIESDKEEDDVKMDDEEQRQLQRAIEESMVDSGTQSGNDSGTEVTERIDEPVNAFEGLSREELLEVTSALEEETTQLQKQRGQFERIAVSITEQMSVEAQALLELFGVPYVISPMEAEAQCAYLDLTNQTSGTITDDSDIWLFGGRTVYKNFFNQSRHVEVYRQFEIRKQLLLDRFKIINLALMCGSDYTTGIQGIGPVTALEVLAEFPGQGLEPLKSLRKWWDIAHKQKKIPSETKIKSKLRQVELSAGFPSEAIVEAYIKPVVDDSEEIFSWAKPNIDLLAEFAREKLGWNKDKTDETLQPVIKSMEKTSSQASITSFFMTQTIGEPKKLKSKRILQTLTRMRHVEKEAKQEVQDRKGTTPKTEIVKTEPPSPGKKTNPGIKSDKDSGKGSLAAPQYLQNTKAQTSRKEAISERKTKAVLRGGKSKSRGRGRGRATGSIPVVPVEVVQSTGRGRRNPHVVVLSESSSSSDSEDEKPKRKQSGGFL